MTSAHKKQADAVWADHPKGQNVMKTDRGTSGIFSNAQLAVIAQTDVCVGPVLLVGLYCVLAQDTGSNAGRRRRKESLVKVSKVGFMLPWWRERWSLDCPCFSYDTVHTCGQCVPNTVEEVTWEMSLTNKAF